MLFWLQVVIFSIIGASLLTLKCSILYVGILALDDPMYSKLKPKGKVKYFISQLLEVEYM